MFYFLFNSIPWMIDDNQNKKLCITLFFGTLCYILACIFLFNKKDDYVVHRVIYYSMILIIILDLTGVIYSYKDIKNKNIKKEYEKKIIKEREENSAAKIIQNWWIRWRIIKS